MFTKTLIAAVLVAPALALSAAAYAGPVYQGGPKSPLATYTNPEAKAPYAQYVPAPKPAVTPHGYQGGPKTNVPHRPQ